MATVKRDLVNEWKEQFQKMHADLQDIALREAIERKESVEAQENEIKAKQKALQEQHKLNAARGF